MLMQFPFNQKRKKEKDIGYIIKMCVKIEKSSFLMCQNSFFFTIDDASARPKTKCKINEMNTYVILHIRN